MDRKSHILNTNWRENDATALEERVSALDDWLDHTEDMIEMLAGDKEIVTNSLSLSGLVRTRKNDIASIAAKLRAIVIDKNTSLDNTETPA